MDAAIAILAIAFFAPLAGALCISAVPHYRPGLMRRFALAASAVSLVCATVLVAMVVSGGVVAGRVLGVPLRIDGVSVALFGTSALLGLVSVVYSRVVDNARSYFWVIALAQMGVVGAFSSLSLFGFWAFWMVTAVCICLLIGRWGSNEGGLAPQQMIAPVFSVLAVMGLAFTIAGMAAGGFGFPAAASHALSPKTQLVVFGLLLAAFGSTIGLFPLHFWLPPVHEGLTAGPGLLLDGSLFLMGVYGLVRIAPLLAPEGFAAFRLPLAVLSAVSVPYGALGLAAQHDLRRMTAYVTVSYSGLIGLCIATGMQAGMVAAIVLAVGRVAASALLIVANQMVHARLQTLDARRLAGIATPMPLVAALLGIAVAGVVGVPALSTFPGLVLMIHSMRLAGMPVALGAIALVGFLILAIALARAVVGVCVGVPSDPVAAYVRHLAKDPFDIIVAGQRVPVDVESPDDVSESFAGPVLAGDLAGLADFEFATPEPAANSIPIERLREGIDDASAARIANPQTAEELSVLDELSGIADLPLSRMGADGQADGVEVTDDEWESAARALRFDAPGYDDWEDDEDGEDGEGDGGDAFSGLRLLEGHADAIEAPAIGSSMSPAGDFSALDALVLAWDADAQGAQAEGDAEDAAPASPAAPAANGDAGLKDLVEVLEGSSMLIDLSGYRIGGTRGVARTGMFADSTSSFSHTERAFAASTAGDSWRIPRRRRRAAGNVVPLHAGRDRSDEEMIDAIIDELAMIERTQAEQRTAASIEGDMVIEESQGRRQEAGSVDEGPGERLPRRTAVPPAVAPRRQASPDDPEAYEVLDDRSFDPSFRRSTLTRSDLAAALLLIAAMLGFGLGSSVLAMLVDPAVASLWQGLAP